MDFVNTNSLEIGISRVMDFGTLRLWDFETVGSNPNPKQVTSLMGRSGMWPRADPTHLGHERLQENILRDPVRNPYNSHKCETA